MKDPQTLLNELRRPRLLVKAARIGLQDYDRDRDLKRLMRLAALPNPQKALNNLLAEEAELEAGRKSGDMSYSFMRHVDVLIALMAEARILLRRQPQA